MESDAKKSEFICSICEKSFINIYHLTRHQDVHSKKRPYGCSLCTIRCNSVPHLNRHLGTHGVGGPFVCSICKKQFNTKYNLQRHEKLHESEDSHSNDSGLKGHEGLSEIPKPMHIDQNNNFCKVCCKVFKNRYELESHMSVHSDERPYLCTICTKCYKSKSSLRKHKLTHNEERAFQCELCPKAFKHTKDLRKHMTVHSDIKPFSCSVCNKAFRTKYHVKRHMGVHTKGMLLDWADEFDRRNDIMRLIGRYSSDQQSCSSTENDVLISENMVNEPIVNISESSESLDLTDDITKEPILESFECDVHIKEEPDTVPTFLNGTAVIDDYDSDIEEQSVDSFCAEDNNVNEDTEWEPYECNVDIKEEPETIHCFSNGPNLVSSHVDDDTNEDLQVLRDVLPDGIHFITA